MYFKCHLKLSWHFFVSIFYILIVQQGKGRMAWVVLIVAGMLEVVWAYCMKVSDGFTKLTPSLLTLIFMIASFALLSYAMKSLPLGTAYTVWTGIGAVGSFAVGIIFLGEPASAMRMLAAVMIISGLVLMKLSSA